MGTAAAQPRTHPPAPARAPAPQRGPGAASPQGSPCPGHGCSLRNGLPRAAGQVPPQEPAAARGGRVPVSYLEFGGAPFIPNQQQVTLPVHHDLLLKPATLGREQGRGSGQGSERDPGKGRGLQSRRQRQTRRRDRVVFRAWDWSEEQTPAPREPDLTLRRLLLHVGAGQVAVHQRRLPAGQVPHDALEQRDTSPRLLARSPERGHPRTRNGGQRCPKRAQGLGEGPGDVHWPVGWSSRSWGAEDPRAPPNSCSPGSPAVAHPTALLLLGDTPPHPQSPQKENPSRSPSLGCHSSCQPRRRGWVPALAPCCRGPAGPESAMPAGAGCAAAQNHTEHRSQTQLKGNGTQHQHLTGPGVCRSDHPRPPAW